MTIKYGCFYTNDDQFINIGLFDNDDDAYIAAAEHGLLAEREEFYIAPAELVQTDAYSVDYKPAEPCGYCGDANDPDIICKACYGALSGPEETVDNHTPMCHEYWDRGLNCQCIDAGVKQAIRNGANPEDVM